uniref:Uncharacterized protein n=1 Tax=Timema shepardi TaxID=629360 RepID=A0A7R9ANJ2_TIMSH|nr:unnamed protein product [Timema shepardi]
MCQLQRASPFPLRDSQRPQITPLGYGSQRRVANIEFVWGMEIVRCDVLVNVNDSIRYPEPEVVNQRRLLWILELIYSRPDVAGCKCTHLFFSSSLSGKRNSGLTVIGTSWFDSHSDVLEVELGGGLSRVAADSEVATDNEGFAQEWFDEDFGLSRTRQEAEELRLQQLQIEQEAS